MEDQQLLRYSRQIMLPGIDIDGQERLFESRVLIIGLGGLGSPVSMYLAASGVGHLVLSDFDKVDLSNLQRQIVHTTANVGVQKVVSARHTLLALNPEIKISGYPKELHGEELLNQVTLADLVIDATDNFTSRFGLNAVCSQTGTPLISGAAIRMEGQVSVFEYKDNASPCYQCLYPNIDELGERCADTGILGSVVGIIGSVQATEAVKVLLNFGESLGGKLLILDARRMEWRSISLRQDPNCPVCQARKNNPDQ